MELQIVTNVPSTLRI